MQWMFKGLPHQITLSVITPGQDKRSPRIATFLSQLTGNIRGAVRRDSGTLTGSSTVIAGFDQSSIANRELCRPARRGTPKRAGFSDRFLSLHRKDDRIGVPRSGQAKLFRREHEVERKWKDFARRLRAAGSSHALSTNC